MHVPPAFRSLSLVTFILACGHLSLARDEPSLAPAEPTLAREQASDTPPAGTLREQTIYVPYDKLRETFEQEGRGVFLPYEKFQELWQAARQTQPRAAEHAPPLKALITDVESEAVVEKDIVRVTSLVRIDVLGQGWIEVPLRLSDVAMVAAQLGDQDARLITDRDGNHKLLLHKETEEAEQIQLQLEYAKGISKTPGQNSVSFQPPQAPVNRWRIRIPEVGVKVDVHPMLAATEAPRGTARETPSAATDAERGNGERSGDEPTEGEAAEGESGEPSGGSQADETVVLAFVGAAPTVRIDWTPKTEGARGLDALVSVRSEQLISVDEGIVRTETRLDYEISRAELQQLVIQLPADQRVVNVVDANVRQWNVETEGQQQQITVGLFQPARSHQVVTVESEKFTDPSSDAAVSAPVVKAVDAGRQLGILVVRLADGLRAEVARRAALSQLDSSEIPNRLSGKAQGLSYRYASLPFELSLQVEKIEPRIRVDQLAEVFLQPERITVDWLATYEIQRAGVFELQLDVPEGYEVRHVRGQATPGAQAAVVESYLLEGEPNSRLKVNLGGKAMGKIGLLVELEQRLQDANLLSPTGEASELVLVPPRVPPAAVQQASGRLVVYAPESLRVAVRQLTGLRTISVDQAYQDAASAREGRFPELRAVQALAFGDSEASATLAVERRQPQVSAAQLLVVQVEPGVLKCEATFYFDIRYSSVKQLRVDVPTELAGQIRNETSALREKVVDPPPSDVAEGYVAWSLTGETELAGPTQCKLTWETPLEQLAIGSSVHLTVPRLVPRDVDRASGQIVLVKAETIDLQPEGEPVGLDPIDPQHDLMAGASVPEAAAAMEFHDDWRLSLAATRYQLETLKHTSIERALLRMVITRSNRVSLQALYRMRSNRQRLEIQLPAPVATGQIEFDTNPLRINGQRTSLERGTGDQTFFVPLAGHDTNQPFLLELRYTIPGTGASLQYPVFPDEPAVQMVHLVAYIPQEWSYVGSRGPWTDETEWRPDPLLRRVPRPARNIDQLIRELTRGINVSGDPAEEFSTDGRPLLFTTLRPPEPAEGALRLATIDSRWLHGLAFGALTLCGVLLLRRPLVDRMVVACGLVCALLLAGAFLPTLTYAVLNRALILALGLVGLLWLTAFVIRAVSRPEPPRQSVVPSEITPGAAAASAPSPPASASPAVEPPPDDPPSGAPGEGEGGRADA